MIGIHRRILNKYTVMKHRYRKTSQLSDETKRKVKAFYSSDLVSCIRPEKRFRGRRLMTLPCLQAFTLFHKNNPKTKLGFTSFYNLRPKNVMIFRKYHFTCLCVYCNNINILLGAINKRIGSLKDMSISEKAKMKIMNVYELSDLVMCPKRFGNKFHDHLCVGGT